MMFEEIEKLDKKLPSNQEMKKQVKKVTKKYNIYQMLSFFVLFIGLIMGIIAGNMYAVCSSYSNVNQMCIQEGFNFSLMLVVWSITGIVGIILHSLGKIVEILSNIEKNLSYNSKKK